MVGYAALEDPTLTRDRPIPMRSRTVPQSEHPRGIWIAPIKGVFQDVFERWADHFNETTFSIELEPGIVWRSTTSEDRSRLTDWFDFYQEFHAPDEAQSVIQGADSVLSPTEPGPLEERGHAYARLVGFVTALSLHTAVPLNGRLLSFEIEESPEARVLPVGGFHPIETTRLRTWGNRLQEPLPLSRMEEVPPTFQAVMRALDQTIDHAFLRTISAYRGAVSRQVFMDAIPILTCASLEALTGAYKEDAVIRRLVPRYVPDADRSHLEQLYRLRHWFAHGAAIPEMRDPTVRDQTLDKGLALTKEILRTALADEDLFNAATSGTRTLGRLLDS